MILTKHELIQLLNNEIRLVLHLAGKVGPGQLNYRPADNQRSTLELLRYLSIIGHIHLRVVIDPDCNMGAFGRMWTEYEAASGKRGLEETVQEIQGLPKLFEDSIGTCSDEFLSEQVELFGSTQSRSHWLIALVLTHYSAYRMQLYLYLKASGRPDLNTMNLWVGRDGSMKPEGA